MQKTIAQGHDITMLNVTYLNVYW